MLRLLAGALSAILFVAASSITLGQGRSSWAGYLYSGVGIGIAFTGIVVPIADAAGGWKAAWQALALGGSIFGIISWHTLKKVSDSKTEASLQTARRFIRDRAWFILLISYGLEGIGYIITATFIVQMINAMPELSHIANQSWILIGLAAAPSTYLWAKFAQKTSTQISLMLAFGLQAMGILLPVIVASRFSILIGGALFGGTFMGITSLTITLAARIKPEHQMQAIGELTAVYALGQIIGPIAAAFLKKNAGSSAPSYFAISVLIIALFALAALRLKYAKVRN